MAEQNEQNAILGQSKALPPNCITRRSYSANTIISTGSQALKHNDKVKLRR